MPTTDIGTRVTPAVPPYLIANIRLSTLVNDTPGRHPHHSTLSNLTIIRYSIVYSNHIASVN